MRAFSEVAGVVSRCCGDVCEWKRLWPAAIRQVTGRPNPSLLASKANRLWLFAFDPLIAPPKVIVGAGENDCDGGNDYDEIGYFFSGIGVETHVE